MWTLHALAQAMRLPVMMIKYQKRISCALLDYIDINIEVLRVDYEKSSWNKMIAGWRFHAVHLMESCMVYHFTL